MKSDSRRGFTLIELLTVIAIIGIMAGMLFPAINAVKRKSKIATSQSTFSQWCSAVMRYKQNQNGVGIYPPIGTKYDSSIDSLHKLDDPVTAVKFVKSLSGKAPSGSALSTADRTAYNRTAEEFCAFSREDYAYYSSTIDTNTLLVDKFGNYKVRVVFDTDNTGSIKKISGVTIPDDINSAKNGTGVGIDSSTGGIPAHVIIFTSANEAASYDGTTNTPLTGDDAADIIAIQ